MIHFSFLRSAFVVLIGALAGLTLVAVPATSTAGEDDSEYVKQRLAEAPHPFNGSFAEWSARGGPILPSAADASTGWMVDLGFRNSFPMYLGDNRIAYNYRRWSVDERTVQIHGLHATLGLHPFYLALLSEGWRSHVLASLHLELGLGPQWKRIGEHQDQESSSAWGLGTSLGAGFDVPLTAANRGRSLWVNTVYRRTWTTLDMSDDATSDRLHDHVFFFGLAWRSNGVVW